MITKSDWDTIQHELLDVDQQHPLGDPPTVEEMLAYTRGELSPEDEERVRRLLVLHPELAHALTAPLPEEDAAPGEDGHLPPEELTRRWTELRRSIHGDGGSVVQFWRRASLAIAAALVLAIGGLLGQARWSAHRLQAELARPRAASEYVVLMPDGQRGRPHRPVRLAPNADSTMLVAPLVGSESMDGYRLRIRNESGAVIWTSEPLHLRDDDTFAILVPRAFLKSGKHQVVLYGIDGTREEQLATYSLTVP
ncbi:MAG TPA: hypothetical protein VGR02_00380 [Thermoanaerobaculia bacterium]|jgi:hypothetical protein|nr:hypothetical protein [Thermoanaerobaculia bacterium]